MQVVGQLEQAMDLAAAAPCRPAVMTDDLLLADIDRWEALGRLVDARRVALAGEVAWRSREQLGDGGLARRLGDRSGVELLGRALRIGVWEARRRVGLGLRWPWGAL